MDPIIFQLENNADVALNNYISEQFNGSDVIELVDTLADGGTGTAIFDFTGLTGLYNISVDYIDEEDGAGSIDLSVGAAPIALDQSAAGDGNVALTGSFGTSRFIEAGQEIVLTGTREGDEFARVDSLTFTPVGLGSVSFDDVTFNAGEGDGTATISLVRTGSTVGAIEVTLNLADGTATAGSDYNGTAITVAFADGQETASVEVPIAEDAVDEPNETVILSLTSSNGNAFVGEDDQATLVITDNDAANDGGTEGDDDGNDDGGDDGVTDGGDDGGDDGGVVSPGADNTISGTSASEVIPGTADDDTILGGGGDDIISGFGGNDVIDGQDGRDLIFGDAGDDVISGGNLRDVISGNDGDDNIAGNGSKDIINGGAGDDLILGGAGRDIIEGDKGDDIIRGGQGADIIRGNKGNDVMRGGDGRDSIRGGAGEDVYVAELAKGFDLFEGFQKGIDTIRLIDGLEFEDLTIRVSGNDSVIRLTETNERIAIVLNTNVNDASNFS